MPNEGKTIFQNNFYFFVIPYVSKSLTNLTDAIIPLFHIKAYPMTETSLSYL